MTMMMATITTIHKTLLLLVLLLGGSAWANKDNTYYPPGKSNPNVNDRMYWQDSLDVLQDLSQFYKLYVKFENCAYSPFGVPSNNDENLDYEQYWYMGSTQVFRANVAFSLYGVLKGSRDKGCAEATFINSFFTRYGVQTFIEAMRMNGYLGGDYYNNNNNNGNNNNNNQNDYQNDLFYAGGNGMPGFTSVCTREIEDDGYEAEAYQYGNGYGVVVNGTGGSLRFPNALSYTLGCYDGAFRLEAFTGATCSRNQFSSAIASLDSATNKLHHMGCAEIYNADKTSYTLSMDDDFWNDDNGQGGNYFDEDEADNLPTIYYPLDLLKYSDSCSKHLYPDQCPDPYGRLDTYLDRLYRGTRLVVYNETDRAGLIKSSPSLLLLIGSVMLLLVKAFYDLKTRAGKDGISRFLLKYFGRGGNDTVEDNYSEEPKDGIMSSDASAASEKSKDASEASSDPSAGRLFVVIGTGAVLAIGAGLSAAGEGIRKGAIATGTAVKEFFIWLGPALKEAVSRGATATATAANDAAVATAEGVSRTATWTADGITNVASYTAEGVVNTAVAAKDGVVNTAAATSDGIAYAANSTVDGIAYAATSTVAVGEMAVVATIDPHRPVSVNDPNEEFPVGTRIILQELVKAAHLNDRHGSVSAITTGASGSEKRYLILLDVEDPDFPNLKVKQKNIRIEKEATPAPSLDPSASEQSEKSYSGMIMGPPRMSPTQNLPPKPVAPTPAAPVETPAEPSPPAAVPAPAELPVRSPTENFVQKSNIEVEGKFVDKESDEVQERLKALKSPKEASEPRSKTKKRGLFGFRRNSKK
eukprot:CAMPEP_0168732362 /NCGR_PEP_ID=MMETSP0724-20121128/7733_1 /TAXON_ID=265536 /ORGANISM="Amphiprora sp., Strain CCMP467" /LENGTH=810 /DNA_ID=CAMNT_0008779381 /DNA_START=161 /DNA_END=2593 /DNA_ORIENTATION=+